MCNLLIFGIFWKASMLYKLHCKDSFHALHWTLKCKLIYVRLCWRKIVFIISDKFTRYIKLLGDVWESKKRVCLNCNCCIGRRVFSWCLTHYRSPESEKRFIFLRNFIIRYSSWAENFPGLIFASVFCVHEYINCCSCCRTLCGSNANGKSLKARQTAQEDPSLLHYCVIKEKN